jgi:LmbE family N-acetylglucosaminyl deacetylase
MNYTELYTRIQGLKSSISLLHVGAHPDDEDVGLLAYTAFKHFGRAVYWSATRGEGGQNMVNHYLEESLGVYRTWESLAAREMDGGECLFGSFMDFGFSKTAEETFSRWGRERLTRELVQAIRQIQPRIVVSKWEGRPADGHGQHQAVGQALQDAFNLAADPEAFPDLIAMGYPPWQPERFYTSLNKAMYPTGERDYRYEKQGYVQINTGEYSPFLGRTYQEQALLAYLYHRTQGINVLPQPGDFYYYFRSILDSYSDPVFSKDLFFGLDSSLLEMTRGIKTEFPEVNQALRIAESSVQTALNHLDPNEPSKAAPYLIEGLNRLKKAISSLKDINTGLWDEKAMEKALKRKAADFEKAIAGCLGLSLEAVCTRSRITPGESVWLRGQLRNYGKAKIDDIKFEPRLPKGWEIQSDEDKVYHETENGAIILLEAIAGNNANLSCPYWLVRPRNGFIYNIKKQETSLLPFAPALPAIECTIKTGNTTISLSETALHRSPSPGLPRELPISLIPPISLHPEFTHQVLLVRDTRQIINMRVTARCNDDECPVQGRLALEGPDGWSMEPANMDIHLDPVNNAQSYEFRVTVSPKAIEGNYSLKFNIHCRGRTYESILEPIRMGGDKNSCFRETFLIRPSTVTVNLVAADYIQGLRYGYVLGASEQTAFILRDLGIPIETMDDTMISHGDLMAYDAIVIGPNAYLLRSALRNNAHRFLNYMDSGGTLIVQYQGYGYDKKGLAPYPFTYHRPHDRVTDERAEVDILIPDDPLFHFPNKIQKKDFNNWVKDRGLYFFGEWDNHYTSLLSSADKGESPKTGGLMKCEYGQGVYFYVGYSLYKQIQAGIAGGFSMFFNLLSTPGMKR